MDIQVDSQTVIVFDLDDTLYNEIEYLKSAYIQISKELEPNKWKRLYATLFSMYRNKLNAFEYITSNYDISVKYLIELYRNHYPDILPFPGVVESLKKIKTIGGHVAVLTDGRSITQRNKISALGLNELIDFIIISEEIGTEKPNKKNFLAIEKKFNANNYYYIGDNIKKDFISPNSLKWNSVCILDAGLNIHSNAYNYINNEHQPERFALAFKDLNFIKSID